MNDTNIILEKNILDTIVYYDILDYPLTAFELWKYLIVEMEIRSPSGRSNLQTLGNIIEALESKEIKKYIEEYRGFYFLKERKDLVGRRIQNDKNSIAKFKIAERVAWWLRFVPFVRMVAVTGTLAMKNPEQNSDIDYFMVLEKDRIFTGRLLVTAMVHFLRKRRYGKKIKNRICLNYFITTRSLEIQRQDLFAANEYSFIYPLFGHNVFQVFCETNLKWIKKFKPNWQAPEIEPAKYYLEHSKASRFVQKTKETLINFLGGDIIEAWLKRHQIARILRNPLTKKEGAYIEATDENLIFLPEPQGVRIYEEYDKRLNELTSSGVVYDESFN
ncbi:hypothetical protein D4R51_03280 [bacterium]|nr:MAG: hypothetical protein D4R51_03280 [bacterium]